MGAIEVPLTNKYKLRVQGEEIGTRLIRITRKIKWDCLGDTSATQIDFFSRISCSPANNAFNTGIPVIPQHFIFLKSFFFSFLISDEPLMIQKISS